MLKIDKKMNHKDAEFSGKTSFVKRLKQLNKNTNNSSSGCEIVNN